MRHSTYCLQYAYGLLLFVFSIPAWAQGYNSVPMGHAAYDIIEIGVMRGLIRSLPPAKPWSLNMVTETLQEMTNDPAQVLSPGELAAITRILDSFMREPFGLSWESTFSMRLPNTLLASTNTAEIYAEGNLSGSLSWNVTALGQFLYIQRDVQGSPPVFSHNAGKIWDGGVFSLYNSGVYTGWPDDPSFALGATGEINFAANNGMHFRFGRIRRDWGLTADGASLFINAQARPFTALEGTVAPLSWMHVSFLGGMLEHYREDSLQPDNEPFTSMLTLAQIVINPPGPFCFTAGGTAALFRQFNGALFTGIELRLPGYFKLWGSLFVDSLDFSLQNFTVMNSNRLAFQAGIKAPVNWLPFAVFTLRYTKIEPYCYTNAYNDAGWQGIPSPSSFVNGGESLGYYLPPNSDELLIRAESRFLPDIKAFAQYQMMRRGADFGDKAVSGSSLNDTLTGSMSRYKYFLMDGVYKWDTIIKLGGSYHFRAGGIPLAVYTEMGFIATRFTINGDAGAGNEAEYEPISDSVYRSRNSFIFTIGFRIFPR